MTDSPELLDMLIIHAMSAIPGAARWTYKAFPVLAGLNDLIRQAYLNRLAIIFFDPYFRISHLLAIMKSTSVKTLASLAILTPAILADFTIYISGIGGNGISGNTDGWQVYPTTEGVLPCDDPLEWIWRDSDDVGGLKYGVRCDGDGSSCSRSGSGDGISELEFKTRQYGDDTSPHFSM